LLRNLRLQSAVAYNKGMKILKKLHNYPPMLVGFAQAAGVTVYVALFATFITWIEESNTPDPPQFVAMLFFLTAFIMSALVCGGLVLAYPATLALQGNIRRAIITLLWSVACFFAILLIVGALILAL